jgi:HAMP domain-containing protein
MQPTVQSEQDKMVPIDTSGDPVEIELKEEEKKEGEVQVEQEQPQVEVKEDKKEEELEEYSQSVKRRIDKLTRKMREAERREQAAIEYAKQIQEENKNLKTTSVNTSRERVTSDEASITSTETLLNTAYKQAVEQGDVDKQVEAQQKIAELAIEKERLRLRKNRLEQQTAQEPEQTVEQAIDAQPQQPAPDPKAQEWAADNKWFGTDKAMTYTAMSFHDELVAEGFDATSDEYYNEIDRRIRKEFPQKFEDQSKPKQTVASAVRKSASGRRTVKLTPSQVAIAKKLGVPLEEYAKHVKEA